MFDSLAFVPIINKHTPGKRNIMADRLSLFQGDLCNLSAYASAKSLPNTNSNHFRKLLILRYSVFYPHFYKPIQRLLTKEDEVSSYDTYYV